MTPFLNKQYRNICFFFTFFLNLRDLKQYRDEADSLMQHIESDEGQEYMKKIISRDLKTTRCKKWAEAKKPIDLLPCVGSGPITIFENLVG